MSFHITRNISILATDFALNFACRSDYDLAGSHNGAFDKPVDAQVAVGFMFPLISVPLPIIFTEGVSVGSIFDIRFDFILLKTKIVHYLINALFIGEKENYIVHCIQGSELILLLNQVVFFEEIQIAVVFLLAVKYRVIIHRDHHLLK